MDMVYDGCSTAESRRKPHAGGRTTVDVTTSKLRLDSRKVVVEYGEMGLSVLAPWVTHRAFVHHCGFAAPTDFALEATGLVMDPKYAVADCIQ